MNKNHNDNINNNCIDNLNNNCNDDDNSNNCYDNLCYKEKIGNQCIEIIKLNEKILFEIENIFIPFFNNIKIALCLLSNEQSTTLTYSTALYLNNMICKTVEYIQCVLINQGYANISSKNVNSISFNVFIKNLCDQNELLKCFYTIKTNGIFSVIIDGDKLILVGYNFTTNDYTLIVMENLLAIELQIKSLISEYKKYIENENKICLELDNCCI